MDEEMKMHGQKVSIEDEDLEQVSGGSDVDSLKGYTVIRTDSKGNATHWWSKYSINKECKDGFHFVCPHCGRLLHQGFLGRLYCDPCDEGWFVGSLPDGCRHGGIYPGC
ncbi:hypothetical protein [Fusicatenibacter sp.]